MADLVAAEFGGNNKNRLHCKHLEEAQRERES